MRSEIKKIIEQIYFQKDYCLFVRLCESVFPWRTEFVELCRKNSTEIAVSELEDIPQLKVYLHYPDTKVGNFKARYRSEIAISKIEKVFYLCHSFEVTSFDPERIEPTLGNYLPVPFVMKQYNFEQIIVEFLQKKGFVRLNEQELYEVASLEELPENGLFGTQLTVYNALFEDVYNLFSKGKAQESGNQPENGEER